MLGGSPMDDVRVPAPPLAVESVTAASFATEPAPPQDGSESLSRAVSVGFGWSLLGTVIARLTTVLSGIALARLLTPSQYGAYAVALIVLSAILTLNDLGAAAAIIRWQEDPDDVAPTVASLVIVGSVAMYLACFAVAPYVARTLHAAGATAMIRVLCIAVFADAVAAVPASILSRRLMQKRRIVIDTIGLVSSAVIAIALALAGIGAWSMIIGSLTGNLVTAALVIAWSPQRFWPGYDRGALRELLEFGIPVATSGLIVFLSLNVDYIVVGHILGGVSLGLYLMAFNLSSWPVNLISVAVRRVSMVGFARLAYDEERAARALVRSAILVVAATAPLCALLALYARPLMLFLYGSKWVSAAPALRFLAILGFGRVLAELAYDYLTALGRPRPNVVVQTLWVACLIPALALGAHLRGITGVAIGHAIVVVVIILPAYVAFLKLPRAHLKSAIVGNLRSVAGLAVLAVSAIPVLIFIKNSVVALAVGGVVGLALYAVVMWPLRSELPFDVSLNRFSNLRRRLVRHT
jgi:O-antigen/teichoic acid export membrane protein